jgi:hypothetical protein
LINNASKTLKNDADYLRTKRYLLREFFNIISTNKRSQKCGNTPIGEVQLVVGKGKPHFRGLFTCNSVHACPVCAAKILMHRIGELKRGISNHLSNGGHLAMLTLTVPHIKTDSLPFLLAGLANGWSKILNTSTFSKEKALYSLAGWVKSNEQTHGWNGWHPHSHIVLFLDVPLTDENRSVWLKTLNKRFRAGLLESGIKVPSGFTLDLSPMKNRPGLAATLASYLCKQGFIGGRTDHLELNLEPEYGLTPLELLERAKASGNLEEIELFRDYQAALHGKRQIQWSKDARLNLGLGEEITDDEIMELEDDGPQYQIIFHPITLPILTKSAWIKSRLLTAFDEGGIQELEWFLDHFNLEYQIFEVPEVAGV